MTDYECPLIDHVEDVIDDHVDMPDIPISFICETSQFIRDNLLLLVVLLVLCIVIGF